MAGAGVDLETFIPALVGLLYSRLTSTGMPSYGSVAGIGMMDFRVLTMLANEPDIPAARIVDAVGLDKGPVSRTLRSLQARGLVDAANGTGRNARYRLATDGRAAHDRAIQLTELRQEILLEGISPTDIQTAVLLLKKMIMNAEKLKGLTSGAKFVLPADKSD